LPLECAQTGQRTANIRRKTQSEIHEFASQNHRIVNN
jgi:hypothetical protein